MNTRTDHTPTLLDRFREREEKFRAELEQNEKAARKRIADHSERSAELTEELRKKERGLEKDKKAFLKLLQKLEEEEEARIRTQSKTEEDFRTGRIDFSEYFSEGKKETQIQKEAGNMALQKICSALPALREKELRVQEIKAEISELQKMISGNYQRGLLRYYTFLESLKINIKESGGLSSSPAWSAQVAKKEAETLRKMKGMPEASRFIGLDLDGMKLLFCDPRIRMDHFEDLTKLIEKLEAADLDGKAVTVTYRPVDADGTPAGFSHVIVPRREK
jgi:hypothetical protein